MFFNEVTLVGRIATDIEVKKVLVKGEERPVCNFMLAISRGKSHNQEEKADFIPITAWGEQASNLYAYQRKGSLILVAGEIRGETYANRDGEKKFRVDVRATKIRYLEPKGKVRGANGQGRKKEEEDLKEDYQSSDVYPPSDSDIPLEQQYLEDDVDLNQLYGNEEGSY
ncbi:single-stranded DNA-binding protein [Listeria kieliensis]